jgi:squalene cyclase
VAAAADGDPAAGTQITPEAEQAINRALEYLASRQTEQGAFGYRGYRANVAVCSLAGMAFLSQGSTPGRGKYGQQVTRCVDYLVSHAQETGFIVEPEASSHGPMYGHGFATLFLAEVYGMSSRPDLRETLSRAATLIVDTQNEAGGWRYQPLRRDADISVTICQVMALRAARNAGLFVPAATIDKCIQYVRQSQNADGGFMYTLDGGPSAFPRSAAGIVTLYSAGVYEGEELERGLAYLLQFLPTDKATARENHFFYGQYYAAQAMWLAGDRYWQQWYPAARELLIARQSEDGSWASPICSEYGTAMAAIVLQMPNNLLPIFQR